MVKRVVIVRFDLERRVAFLIIGIVVKFTGIEHISKSISIHRHGLIPTGQDVPATHILIGWVVGVDIIALSFIERIVILNRFPQSREQFAIIWEGIDFVQRYARWVGRPCSYVLEEWGRVWVVYHRHVGIGDVDVVDQKFDVLVCFDGVAGIEPSAETGNGCLAWLRIGDQPLKGLSDHTGTVLVMHSEVFSHDLVKTTDIEVLPVAVVVDGSWCSMSHINNIGILHPHPGGQHSSVAAPKYNDWAVLAIGFLQKFDKLNEIHHGLLGSKIDQILRGCWSFLISKRPTLTKVSVLGVDQQSLEIFGYVVVVPSCIFVEHFDRSFITAVHQDGSLLSLGPTRCID